MTDINKLTESLDKKYRINESASFESDIYSWLSNHYSETSWKDKFNSYIEKIKSSSYNTTNLSRDINKAIKKFSKEVKVKPQVFTSALKESNEEYHTGRKKLTEAAQHTNYIVKLLNVVNDYIEKRMNGVNSVVANGGQSLQVGDETYTMRVNFVPVYTLSNSKTGDIYRFTTQKGIEYKSNNDVVYDIVKIIKEDM